MPSIPERLFAGFSHVCAFLVTVMPLAAFAVLLWTALSVLLSARALPGAAGIAMTGLFTIGVSASAAVLGGTFGIGCAVAAEELAGARVRRAIDAAIGFLGAIPAVAYGWFAFALVVPAVAAQPLGGATRFAAGTLVLSAMAAPTACVLMKRALWRIPDITRHAAVSAGASRLQTTVLVVLPALRGEMAAAALAAFARAAAEATAMMLLFATLARHGIQGAGTTASWIFSALVLSPASVATAGGISLAALALLVATAICGFVVAREYRGLQWT